MLHNKNLSNNNEINTFLKKYNKLFNHDIKIWNIYNNKSYFNILIQKLYKYKKRKLKLSELLNIFGFTESSIIKRLKKLNLLEYFDIQDSKLELKFKELLENNNINFKRRNKNILPRNEDTNGQPELDFYLKDYNIAFEINDIISHNSAKKDQYYHINKTLQCKEKEIRLIHLWEWELTNEDLWNKTSRWILNLLNSNKIQINSKDCAIKEINNETAQHFIIEYNLYDYIQSDVNLGLYYNNELLQCMSFKHQKNDSYKLLNFCTKFNYNIKDGAQCLLDHFIQSYNPSSITTTINLDKFYGATFEKIGFKLIEYKDPILLGDVGSKYRSIYNCGQNVYQLKLN